MPITRKEIELVIKNLLAKKIQESDGFSGEFCQKYKKELTSVSHTFFQKMRQDGATSPEC